MIIKSDDPDDTRPYKLIVNGKTLDAFDNPEDAALSDSLADRLYGVASDTWAERHFSKCLIPTAKANR